MRRQKRASFARGEMRCVAVHASSAGAQDAFGQPTRRTFLSLLGAAAWPLAAHAQQGGRTLRVGALMNLSADDPQSKARGTALLEGLQELGSTPRPQLADRLPLGCGRCRSSSWLRGRGDVLCAPTSLSPVQLGDGGSQRVTRTVRIVFLIVVDARGSGPALYFSSLARPGGNPTGFTLFEYGVAGKWLKLLKEIAPHLTRVAVLRDPAIAAGIGQLGAIQAVAPSFNVELTPIDVRDAGEIERGVTEFARVQQDGGLIVTGSRIIHREQIVRSLTTRNIVCRRSTPSAIWQPRAACSPARRYGFPVSAGGRYMGIASQRRGAGRPAGAGADQV